MDETLRLLSESQSHCDFFRSRFSSLLGFLKAEQRIRVVLSLEPFQLLTFEVVL